MIHEKCQYNWRRHALERGPQQWEVDADKVVWLNVVAGDAAEIRLANDNDWSLENVSKDEHVKLFKEVVRQLSTGVGRRLSL